MQSEPVLAADDGRGQVGASEPDRKDTEEEEVCLRLATHLRHGLSSMPYVLQVLYTLKRVSESTVVHTSQRRSCLAHTKTL